MEQREIRKLVNETTQVFLYRRRRSIWHFVRWLLDGLQISIMAHEDEINRALRLDLGKSASEAYMCETGMVLAEISYMLKHMRQFGKDQTVRTPLAQFASRSFRKPSPYGVTLIMSSVELSVSSDDGATCGCAGSWQYSDCQTECLLAFYELRSWRRSYRNVCLKNTLWL